jgi:hypothetical protein
MTTRRPLEKRLRPAVTPFLLLAALLVAPPPGRAQDAGLERSLLSTGAARAQGQGGATTPPAGLS